MKKPKVNSDSIELIFDSDNLSDYNGLCVDATVNNGYIDFDIYFENQKGEE